MSKELASHANHLPRVPDLDRVKDNPRVIAYIQKADEQMGAIGYTEHGFRHAARVCTMAYNLATHVELPRRECELVAIAAYMHDLGNVINRHEHGEISAIISMRILEDMAFDPIEIGAIAGAIGNHEEEYGFPISNVSAAVILGDKADVHFTRVRNQNPATFDIHDRVNFAVQRSFLRVIAANKTISLELTIDTESANVMEYFEIFVTRMVMCRKAADVLGYKFNLVINGMVL